MEEDIVFVQSVLEVRIKILKRGLEYIYQKHPELDNQSAVIQECLKNANEIWTSKQDKSVFCIINALIKNISVSFASIITARGF